MENKNPQCNNCIYLEADCEIINAHIEKEKQFEDDLEDMKKRQEYDLLTITELFAENKKLYNTIQRLITCQRK